MHLPETIVVVGATGFIGRNFVRRLKGQVGRIVPVSGSGSTVEGIAGFRLENLPQIDVGPDTVVVNLAAYRYDSANFAESQPQILLRNVEIASRVYEFCVRR